MVSIPTANPAIARPEKSAQFDLQASESRTSKEHRDIDSTALDSRPNHEDDDSQIYRDLTSDAIRNRSIDERSKPCSYPWVSMNISQHPRQLTKQQSRHKPSLEPAVHVDMREPSRKGLHGNNTANDTLVISKQQTTQSRKLPKSTTRSNTYTS